MKMCKKPIFAYSLLLIAQICFFYWARIKTNFYIDELYSFGYAAGFNGQSDAARYITESKEFKIGEWVPVSDLKKHLELSENEKVFHTPMGSVVNGFVKRRNYYGLLNIAESIAGQNGISKWPGIILNVLLFVPLQITHIHLLKRLKIDDKFCFLGVAVFGFSVYMISIAIYIRFYIPCTSRTIRMNHWQSQRHRFDKRVWKAFISCH